MSKIQEILSKFNEQEEILTKDKVIDIIQTITYEELDPEELEDLKEYTFNTMYNEYKAYGFDSYQMIIPAGDYQNYLKDICNEFEQSLPDSFEYFFNTDLLYTKMLQDDTYLDQCVWQINAINDKKDNYSDQIDYVYKRIDSGNYEGIEYIVIKEEIV